MDMQFNDVFCGFSGSVHDARVLEIRPFSRKLKQTKNMLFPRKTHLICNSAYSLKTWVLTPYRYNGLERFLGLFKGRFRGLRH